MIINKTKLTLIVIIPVVLAIAVIYHFKEYHHKTKPVSENNPIPVKSGLAEQIPAKQKPPKKIEIPPNEKGPFPTDKTLPEKDRQIGHLMNTWRKAVLSKNINEIKQLDMQIKGCGDEAIPFLTRLAKGDENERVRAFALRILGRMNKTDLYSLFIELLQNDRSAFVRENACWSLGRLANSDAIEVLQKTADSDVSEQVRKSAEDSIKTIKSLSK